MEFKDCIDACLKSAIECEQCLSEMISKESTNDCPRCCLECVEICLLTAKALSRNSRFSQSFRKICAEACDWCAKNCGEMNHAHCQKCAEACRICSAECTKLVS